MPSLYAHDRFGRQLLPGLPADVRRPIQRCRSLYDIGLQGPDFFFYDNYLSRTPVVELGSTLHNQTGLEFFMSCCSHVRQNPSEEALAYLYGLLAHYCLDSICHPFVYDHTGRGGVIHSVLETEFDRHLLLLDDVRHPHTHNVTGKLRLQQKDFEAIASFYDGVTAERVRHCIRSMRVANGFLSSGEPLRYGVAAFLKLASDNVRGMHMAKTPDPDCAALMEPLMAHYIRAAEQFPEYLEQLRDHLTYNAPLGDIFTATFNH